MEAAGIITAGPAVPSIQHLPMLVRCPCCPLSGLIVCLCCHVNAQPLPAVHGGALQQTNWRLPVQETVAHLLCFENLLL